jgi:hypothetical protein
MCVTAMLNPMSLSLEEFSNGKDPASLITEYGKLPLQVFLYDLRLCSSDTNQDSFLAFGEKGENGEKRSSWIPKTYLKSYDPHQHSSTGCSTEKAKGFFQHTVISHKESPKGEGPHMKPVQLSKMVHGLVDERDEVSFSSENVAASACFNVHPVGPQDSPVLVQASVVVMLDPAYNASSPEGRDSSIRPSPTKRQHEDFTSMYIKSFGNFGNFGSTETVGTGDKQTESKHHDTLHTCLTKQERAEEEEKHVKTPEEKNARMEHRHRRKRFKDHRSSAGNQKRTEEKAEQGKNPCGPTFNKAMRNAKVITVTSEDIVPSTSMSKRNDGFDYEAMQTPDVYGEEGQGEEVGESGGSGGLLDTLKHYYYHDYDGDYYYYYEHPYYHPHIHCKWTLEFRSGSGICESPHIIYPDTFHALMIALGTVGIAIGIVFFIIDWKSRALFRL